MPKLREAIHHTVELARGFGSYAAKTFVSLTFNRPHLGLRQLTPSVMLLGVEHDGLHAVPTVTTAHVLRVARCQSKKKVHRLGSAL